MFGRLIISLVKIGLGSSTNRTYNRNRRVDTSANRTGSDANKSNGNYTPLPVPRPRELSGKVHVIDGDTIVIKRTKIRLAGIDAPELDQPYGQKSKWAMVNICKGQVVTVKLNGETSHDRLVGTCHLPDGSDIGAELVRQGLACDFPCFSGGKYRSLEPTGARRKLRRPPYDW